MKKFISPLFAVAAIYDGLLGFVFLFGADALYRAANVTPPNHPGYVQFPAALLIIFALMFVAIARKPLENRGLIVYGMLLKAAYCGVVGYHWAAGDLPSIWKPFVVFDLLFFVLFFLAWVSLRRPGSSGRVA